MHHFGKLLVSIVVCHVLLLAPVGIVLAAEESVTVISRFEPTPGREAEAEARLLLVIGYVRKAEPDTIYRLHRSTKGPLVLMFYETYPNAVARENHRSVVIPAFYKEFGGPPQGLFVRPPDIEVFQLLAN